MSAAILRGDARSLPLPDSSVDLIVTSPPYWALRSYSDNGEHYDGQIGSEETPAEWLASLLECTREWVRVLKPSGSIFVNLGDKYANDAKWGGRSNAKQADSDEGSPGYRQRVVTGVAPKSLIGLPWRYALACMDELGLTLRRDIVWCLSGGASVYARTSTGDRPVMLRDLVRAYSPESVQLWNGERWTQVLGWNRSPDREGALEIELRTGERIGCTPGHRWPTQRGVIRADEIRIGDEIVTTRLPEPAAPVNPSLLPDDDIGWLVGLYIAEGSRSRLKAQIAGNRNEVARHERLSRIAAALDGSMHIYPTSENGVTANLSGSVIIGVIDRYVSPGTAKTKRLRMTAWQRSDAFLASVVEGYLAGDGHFDAKNNRWRIGFTANDELAADLRTLAARLGAKLSLRRCDHDMDGRKFPGWRGEWRWSRSDHWNAKRDGEVVAIRLSRARDFYDVGVADKPHLFALASGVLTHNSKVNPLPESVDDRCATRHEYLFHFVRQPRYYAAIDEIREPHTGGAHGSGTNAPSRRWHDSHANGHRATDTDPSEYNPLGKLPGSVWDIPSQPLVVPERVAHGRCCGGKARPGCKRGLDHFAAFPFELPRRCILGWSPSAICTACSEGRRPVASSRRETYFGAGQHRSGAAQVRDGAAVTGWKHDEKWRSVTSLLGYACACTPYTDHAGRAPSRRAIQQRSSALGNGVRDNPGGGYGNAERTGPWREYHLDGWVPPPSRPALVVDPFGGTGTTSLMADVLGRDGISFDRSGDYCRLARWRTTDPGERARAMQVPKPPVVPDGQDALFTLGEAAS